MELGNADMVAVAWHLWGIGWQTILSTRRLERGENSLLLLKICIYPPKLYVPKEQRWPTFIHRYAFCVIIELSSKYMSGN